jgi:S-DNA-T family DNA segregation ATPase FtsK/SpoIIIE
MNSPLTFPLGIDTNNEIVHLDIATAPHMLVAGTTGSGKSTFLLSMICSLLMTTTPDELSILTIDTKMVELTAYDGIPNLLCPCVTDAYEAIDSLNALVNMMESRYQLAQSLGAKSLPELNDKLSPDNKLPYILVVVDEIADLMMISKHSVEEAIVRIAQKARAVGIHLVLATQTPRREIITGILKSNLPTNISFATRSSLDSRIISGESGAEKLLGNGDCLYSFQGKASRRLQTPYVSTAEITAVVSSLKSHSLLDIAA